MKKLVVLLCALLALGSSAQALEVSAPSALLMEKETGTVLFAKDEHAKLEPASVTKVMPLLLTMALGCWLRRSAHWSDDFYRQLNSFCFHVLLPVQP